MTFHDFILSEQAKHRAVRHTLFWTTRFLLLYWWYIAVSLFTFLVSGQTAQTGFQFSSTASIFGRVAIDMLYTYTIVGFLVPKFVLKRKYLLFVVFCIAATLIAYLANIGLAITSINDSPLQTEPVKRLIWLQTIIFVNSGPHVVCAIFLLLKMLKNWYKKEEEKIAIKKANNQAALQLLKAQIHPHFLFNTLNNINSFILNNNNTETDRLIQKLSGMMDYMSSDGEKDLVPVEKEFQLLMDYIDLEKVRYGDRLEIQISCGSDFQHAQVAPLLMIPFVENCFKHGAAIARGKQWIRLKMGLVDGVLHFELANSHNGQAAISNGKNGIGLINVKKRLQLLYPRKHQLQIDADGKIFTIKLKIELAKMS